MRTQLRPRAFHHARWMAWAISILLLLTTSSNILASSSSEEIIAAPSLEYNGKHAPPTTPAPTATQPPTPATGAPTTTPATSKDPRVPAVSPAIPALPQTIPRAAPTTHPARIVHRVRGGATGVRRTRRAIGDSCTPADDSQSCSDHASCSDCTSSSWGCHWCSSDEACHAVGSMHGCAAGANCYSIGRCQRLEPERMEDGGTFSRASFRGVGPVAKGVLGVTADAICTNCSSIVGQTLA
eukprot:CAMPEP_0201945212 /NCGR_PEP_ID=MMETSP0903-20130614/53788_1 /ASSEMBLY_ACC=CAM_ASM_000552 /TAXON_ID=420261 /ORGANISM="Thalassiosira antarctica, Strain CCMP982" /LENGTH=239 /DNA_ID=CAMNT_0048488275 /DNA_START=38 /DNA_END=758 /DNA_ORIENTATION=+